MSRNSSLGRQGRLLRLRRRLPPRPTHRRKPTAATRECHYDNRAHLQNAVRYLRRSRLKGTRVKCRPDTRHHLSDVDHRTDVDSASQSLVVNYKRFFVHSDAHNPYYLSFFVDTTIYSFFILSAHPTRSDDVHTSYSTAGRSGHLRRRSHAGWRRHRLWRCEPGTSKDSIFSWGCLREQPATRWRTRSDGSTRLRRQKLGCARG